jgi:hypothetical protein
MFNYFLFFINKENKMNNYSNNTRSMNGLNNINANSLNSNEIDVDILVVNTSGTCPTRPNGDNTLNLANTAFVTNAISSIPTNNVTLDTTQTLTTGIKTFTNLPECSAVPVSGNQLVNKNYVDSGVFVTLNTTQTITGDKTYNGTNEFLSLGASYIYNTSSIDTPNIGSGLATDPISFVPSQSSGTCNIATFGTRSGIINIGTGNSSTATVNIATGGSSTSAVNIATGNSTKTLTVGGTGSTLALNTKLITINTSSTAGQSITHTSTSTTGDDLRLTATGGYLARIGEGSSADGLTLLGVDSGTSIIKATTSALEIRADAGLTFTGTIGSNNLFSGTNTYTGTTSFQNNVTVQAGNTVRYGSRSVGSPSGIDLGQTNVNEITLQLVTTADDFIFRTSGGLNMMTFDNFGITASFPFAMSQNFLINQSTYPSTSTTQLGYTITKTFGPSVLGDTTGTFTVVGTGQALGTNKGVYLITCGFELTNSGSDTVNNKALCLSLSSGSGTPVNSNGAWEYYEEINDSMGSAGTRYKGTLCGVYIKTTTSAQTLYMNGYANTSGSQTISATGNCSITRIG